ncbi:hypothetical protein BC828DRAFT_409908 [Blastocladiella britannica]|nr:hypothetical protein BC828DRAFT_409908 [Blastocladiella britannica]
MRVMPQSQLFLVVSHATLERRSLAQCLEASMYPPVAAQRWNSAIVLRLTDDFDDWTGLVVIANEAPISMRANPLSIAPRHRTGTVNDHEPLEQTRSETLDRCAIHSPHTPERGSGGGSNGDKQRWRTRDVRAATQEAATTTPRAGRSRVAWSSQQELVLPIVLATALIRVRPTVRR